ncbi:MAG: transglutaminase-like domain-containing protein [Spirochaetota bacterium]
MQKSFLVFLLAALSLQCSAPKLEVSGYEQKEVEGRVILSIQGQNFGKVDETKIYINDREISKGHLLNWSDREIRIFIRKPFTSALIQLKKGAQISPYIPVWDDDFLPEMQHNSSIQEFPVLENYELISQRPAILEIRGRNLGFRYQDQLLFFSRKPDNNSVYFDVSTLENYRPLKISEILNWSDEKILLELPQEVVAGPVFLVRFTEGTLQPSNSLYLSSTPNYRQNNSTENPSLLRLSLEYQPVILPSPALWQAFPDAHPSLPVLNGQSPPETEQAYRVWYNELEAERRRMVTKPENQQSEGKAEDSPAQKGLSLEPQFFRLYWPRNELNQYWRVSDSLVFPAQNLGLFPFPEKMFADYGLNSTHQLLKDMDAPADSEGALPERRLYLDLIYSPWTQNPPASSRERRYNEQEWERLRYQVHNNRALIANYRVPHWQFAKNPGSRLSPYWKSLEIYKRLVRELGVEGDASLPSWTYAETKGLLSQWPAGYLTEDAGFISDNLRKSLLPEQVLLLFLRAVTEQNIVARVVAGAVHIPHTGEKALDSYFWLEIYLPGFGWFQVDPLAEIIAYQRDPATFNRSGPVFWGRLERESDGNGDFQESRQMKLAFFVLRELWVHFDRGLSRLRNQSDDKELFFWNIRLPE